MPSVRTRLRPWAVLLLVAPLAGCRDDSPKVVKVTGTLTHKGLPVTNAYIRFRPETGRPSWGQTDDQGRFKLSYDRTQDGAVVGKHKVWIEQRPTTPAEQDAVMPGSSTPVRRTATSRDLTALFDKYGAEKSTYTVDITPDTKDLTIELD
jgi:hypothetical protein